MPKYNFSKKNKTTFEVANIFVDKYMTNVPPVYIIIYLYGLRLCHGACDRVSNLEIAKNLSILESDVINAWKHWESASVVSIVNRQSETEFDIDFVDIANIVIEEKPSDNVAPTYSPVELDIYIKQDKKVKQLFDFAQEKLQKMLTPNDLSILYSFYDYYHMPFEVIFMLIQHYVSKDKKSIRYMEKVVMSWNDKGINTIEKVENQLSPTKIIENNEQAHKKVTNSKNKFVNFGQRNNDYTELDKILQEKRLKEF